MLVHYYLEFYSRNRPLEPCVIHGNHMATYAEVDQLSNRIANGFISLGIKKGERVAILGKNSIHHCLLYMAASKTGTVAVPLNFRLSPAELAYIINDSKARILLVLDSQRETLKSLQPLINKNIIVITEDAVDNIDWNDWTNQQDDSSPSVDIESSDPLLQIYTSGTTGNPKGAVTSHFNLLSLASMNETVITHRSNPGTSCIICAPLFHIGGTASVFSSIYSGQSILIHDSFEPTKLLDDLDYHPVQSVFLVPAMIMELLKVPGVEQRDFSMLRQITYGASPISEPLLQHALEVFQCDFIQMYGMTETSGAVLSLSANDHKLALEGKPELLLSCGRANVGASVKIIDTEGKEVPRGEVGEICVKSDTNMLGYHNLPEETAKTLNDGWIRTGDTGYMDVEDYVYLKGRIKDVVVSGGENIYPVEVENTLAKHEAILDVAVIGIPDEKFGEALLAVIVLEESRTINVDDMISFCRDKIAGYKIPRQLKLVDQLPRNPSGKVLKKALREPYWRSVDRSIG